MIETAHACGKTLNEYGRIIYWRKIGTHDGEFGLLVLVLHSGRWWTALRLLSYEQEGF